MPIISNYQITRLPDYQITLHRHAVAILLLVTLPFWIALTCPFLNFDDPAYVSQNPFVLAGLNLHSIRWAFTTTTGGFWIPLTWLSFMLDASLFGTSPAGFHATNILLHMANAILVYFLLDTLTRARAGSLLVAALWAIHPLRVESVAWITERKDVLALFFGLLAMITYVRYARARFVIRHSSFVISFLLFALSLMAKPMLVTLPFVLLLLDYWPLNRFSNQKLKIKNQKSPSASVHVCLWLILEKIPFFALSAAAITVNYAIQIRDNSLVAIPLALRLQSALVNLALYLRDTFYFGKLSILYPLPDFIPAWQILLAGFLLIAITAAIFAALKKSPAAARPLLVGWLWFLGSLVPFLGFLQSGPQSRADRFSYFPSIGLLLALVFPGAMFAPPSSRDKHAHLAPEHTCPISNTHYPITNYQLPITTASARRVLVILSAFLLLVLATFTTTRLFLWRDPLQLYLDGLAHTQNNVRLEVLAATLLRDQNQFPEARLHYLAAMKISPKDPEIPTMLALLYVRANRLDLALPYFRQACELAPADPAFQQNYQIALAQIRRQSATQGGAR